MLDQPQSYRLMGLDPSPYTVKVASYFTFKGIDFQWLSRTRKREKLFQAHAKVQLIPLLFLPSGETLQDSTPIIERLEGEHPEPSIHPTDPALWFLSCLFEEFGDEWCNKLMFFQRWFYEADARATGRRIAGELLQDAWWGGLAKPLLARLLVRRMVPRLVYSGGNETNIPQLQQSFEELTGLLDVHFQQHAYLLGQRPCFGDFGLWCNLYQAWTDPTAGTYLEQHAPALVAYLKRMQSPSIEGDFASLTQLLPTLEPILSGDIATRFLPWMVANEAAWNAREKETTLTMNGQLFRQKTFKYQAVTLAELRRKYLSIVEHQPLNDVLGRTGCLQFLVPAG